MKSLYEELGGTYRQVGDYFIPDIELPERNYEIGKYGRMRHRYLKEHHEIQYTTMILNGTLYAHLEEIDRICNERMETMVAAMKKQQGITEELKAKERQVAIFVLDMPLLDTRQNRDLTGTLIADIVLQLLSYVAQTEREFIRQRQAEGIAAAKAQGVQFGRRPMIRPAFFAFLKEQWKQHQISERAAAKQLGITHSTFLRWVNEDNG